MTTPDPTDPDDRLGDEAENGGNRGREPHQSRTRRVRSTTESLLSITLVLEAVLLFFVSLTVFGLSALPAIVAFGAGGGLIVALLVATRLVRYRWGVWVGWGLQVVLLASGLILPVMWLVAAVFVAIWVYCFVKGRQIDALRGLAVTDP